MNEQLGLLHNVDVSSAPEPMAFSVARITIRIPGEPFAQPRQRHRLVRTRDGRQFVANYQPKEARNWKSVAQDHFSREMDAAGLRPFAGPLRVEILCLFACPRSDYRKTAPRPERWSLNARDVDNLAKSVMDSGIGACWIDDHQIVDLRVQKRIAAQGAPPEVVVTVEAIEEGAI